MSRRYSVGVVTAYGAAKAGGYAGTYAQFCEDLADLGDNITEVREARIEVDANKTAAQQAQEGAEQAQSDAEAAAESVSQSAAQIEQNRQDIGDLKSAINTKAPVIIDTSSGAIVSFEDGADGMPLKSLTVNVEPVQEGSGDPSPENVRPITGWTGANLARTAKNLGNFADNKSITNSGFIADVDGRVATVDPVVINPGKTYKAVCNNASAKVILAVWNGDTLVRRTANLNVGTVLDTTGGTYFYVCCYMTGSVSVTVDDIEPMVVFADETDLTYAPYQGAVYSISFPTEAGTVYKGALDVVKKELTMLYYGAAINDCNWMYSETTGFFTATDFKTGIYAAKRPATNTIAAKIIAEEFQTTPVNTSVGFDISVSASGNIIIKAPGFTTVADLLNNFGSSKFIFELASPVVYQLTVARITTLFGTNNIWADCGPVSVDYPADTKLYIDALTAPTEDDMIANARIESGKYFMVGNALYLSTALILTGETIIPGTNCTKTNLAAALNALNT